jgi:cell division protein ZapA
MSDTTKTQLDLELTRLTKRIEELLTILEHLKEENRALRTRHESLAGERAALMHKNEQVRDAAEFLNARMREIRDSGKVVGLDRIAVMTALNLAHEFLRVKDHESRADSGVGGRVRALRERVESVLGKGQQLEL